MTRRLGLIGAIAGTAAGAVAVGAYAVDRRISASRRSADLTALTQSHSDRGGVVVAEDGVGLHYEEVGPADAPLTVVFAHGFCLSEKAFVLQREALAEQFGRRVRMVFYDHRSHGQSERSAAQAATIEQLARDLHRIIDTLAPTGPLVLVGHSMGGMTVLALADAHPELFAGPQRRVLGAVLLSTSTGKMASVTFGLPSAVSRVSGPVLPLVLRGARRRAEFVERGRAVGTDLTWLFTKWLSFARDVDPSIVEFCTDLIASTRIETIADFYSTLMRHDKLAALGRLADCDVTVICGDHDLMTPLDHSQAMADALPHAKFVVVPRAGHMALLEAPDEVNAAVGELIDRVLSDLPA